MPRLKESTKRERRDQIARAALACMVRQGYANTSMADIIAESGMSSGSIYSHFTGKAELFRHVAEVVLSTRVEEIAEAAGREHPRPSEVFTVLSASAAQPELGQALLQVWAELPRDAELAGVARDNLARVHEVVSRVLTPWARTKVADEASALELAAGQASVVIALTQSLVVRSALPIGGDAATLRRRLATLVDVPAVPMPALREGSAASVLPTPPATRR